MGRRSTTYPTLCPWVSGSQMWGADTPSSAVTPWLSSAPANRTGSTSHVLSAKSPAPIRLRALEADTPTLPVCLNSCLLHVHLKRLLRLNTSYWISTKGQHQVDSVCFMHVSMWPRLYPPVSERFGGSQSPSPPCVFLFRASLVTSGQPAGEGRGCREFTVRLCPQERRVP